MQNLYEPYEEVVIRTFTRSGVFHTMTFHEGDKIYLMLNQAGRKLQLHRVDGPAIEGANGSKHWFQWGERHREDGPAIT